MDHKVAKKDFSTVLYIVRHGETEWNREDILQGQLDSKLTEKGQHQAAELAQQLQNIHFDAIFSSDLLRARKTAEILRMKRELAIVSNKLLRERNWGRYDGIKASIFRREAKDLLHRFDRLSEKERWKFKFAPEIESDVEIYVRFMTFLREIAVAYRKKRVLVVTHMGVLSTLLEHLGKRPREIHNLAYLVLMSDGKDLRYVRSEGIVFEEGREKNPNKGLSLKANPIKNERKSSNLA